MDSKLLLIVLAAAMLCGCLGQIEQTAKNLNNSSGQTGIPPAQKYPTKVTVQFERNLSGDEIAVTTNVLSARIAAFGDSNAFLSATGDSITLGINDSNQQNLERIRQLLMQEGRLEVLFEGNVLLTGADVTDVITDPQKGYGMVRDGDLYRWVVPFKLTNSGAERFAAAVEGHCTQNSSGGSCQETITISLDGKESVLHLSPGVTQGTPVTTVQITGSAQTAEEASRALRENAAVLKSGRLLAAVADVSIEPAQGT